MVEGALASDSGFDKSFVIYYLCNIRQLLNLYEPESLHLQK